MCYCAFEEISSEVSAHVWFHVGRTEDTAMGTDSREAWQYIPLATLILFSCWFHTKQHSQPSGVAWSPKGKYSGPPLGEENRDVKGEVSKADGWVVDSDLPTECGPQKLTKRSSTFDASWLRGLENRETNCQIFPITTAVPRITPPRVSATTPHVKAASPEEGPRRLFYFVPYYPQRQRAFYNVFFPLNRGASGYNTIWYYKSPREDSSEEKRRKRDTIPTSQKRSKAFLGG
ncbi:uncharacterized protein LOC129337837 [Eublepharis macularius]|uniref:Uncharacterized protein LOC129337837 n=1 Tax=Eublepharis macularius TaxID=481883 RepID=A0AA97K387_EUBMA|nr:uncharacterized protein LOC129337837 [Eublepharis macularius]